MKVKKLDNKNKSNPQINIGAILVRHSGRECRLTALVMTFLYQ
jgi:hypothetical protein